MSTKTRLLSALGLLAGASQRTTDSVIELATLVPEELTSPRQARYLRRDPRACRLRRLLLERARRNPPAWKRRRAQRKAARAAQRSHRRVCRIPP